MNEPVDGGERHGGIGEDPVPIAEGLVGGDQHGSAFVTGADQFEQDRGFGLILADVGDVVEDQEMVLVELVDRRRERQIAARDLKLLDEVGGPGEQDAPAVLDKSEAESRRQMNFSRYRVAQKESDWRLFQASCRRPRAP